MGLSKAHGVPPSMVGKRDNKWHGTREPGEANCARARARRRTDQVTRCICRLCAFLPLVHALHTKRIVAIGRPRSRAVVSSHLTAGLFLAPIILSERSLARSCSTRRCLTVSKFGWNFIETGERGVILHRELIEN